MVWDRLKVNVPARRHRLENDKFKRKTTKRSRLALVLETPGKEVHK
jgi:hypothetical protein